MQASRRLYSTIVKKRFYKEVSLINASTSNAASSSPNFEICLDGRKVKTPKGNVLTIPSEPLALAVAHEWSSQKTTIKATNMHFTGLCITCVDNPINKTKPSLVQNILHYLDNDSLLYFHEEPNNLYELQRRLWLPIVDWTKEQFNVDLKPSCSLDGPVIDLVSRRKLESHLSSYELWPLMGFEYAVEDVKSLLLTLAAVQSRVGVDEAVHLSNLEQKFQIDYWGKVEWAHDVNFYESSCRLSAAVLFIRWTSGKTWNVNKNAP